MSLLRKASIVTTPTSYENGKILSVKPVQSLGFEQIENGNFATDSDWTKGAGWTISGGTANATSAATGTPLSQYIDTGKKYKITYDVVSLSQGAFQVDLSYSGTALGQLVTTTGTFTDIVTSINPALSIRVVGTTTGSIDNVSVKELIDGDFDFTRNSSATRVNSQGLIEDMQILSGDLVSNGDFSQIGSELVTNGDFATDTAWAKGTGWSISGGSANCDGAGNGNYLSQTSNSTLVLGKTYKVNFDITRTSGTILLMLASSNPTINTSGNIITGGSKEFYITISTLTDQNIYFRSNSFNGSIDNVSVKEVGQDWSVTETDANNYVEFGDGTARLKFLNTSPVTQLITSFVMTAGKKYKLTVDVATVTSGGIKVDGNGISETFNTSGITTRIINPTGASAINFYRATANVDITLNSVSLIEITSDTNLPRIDYTGGTGHWLFEPQSTNLFTESENFSNGAWTLYLGATITANNAVSPQGVQNASKLTDVGGIYDQSPYNPNTNYVISLFAKTNTATSITINFVDQATGYLGGTIRYTFATNIASVILQSANGSVVAEKEDYGNGWIRVILKFTTNVAQNYNYQAIEFQGGDGWIWGAQVEQGSYATSYIPTSGAISTRLKDAAFGAGSSDLINSTEGVLYAEIAALADDGTSRLIGLSDGTSTKRINIYYDTSSNSIYGLLLNSSVQGITSFTLSDSTNFAKIAFKYKENDFALWVNGTEVDTDSSGTTFTSDTLNKLSFDRADGVAPFYGSIKAIAVFKEALNNDELECLTGEGYDSFNALALANNYTII